MTNRLALNWINGKWTDAATHHDSIDPATYEVIGRYADAGLADATACIDAAKTAFLTSPWKEDRNLRVLALSEMAASFERHSDALVDLLSTENGKVRDEARFEVGMVAP
ncbi:MAG: aldehyde dehydrogenase, partial [Polaromonas sp.]|nr:aldehyde dehydrogenase [Polaromonas sp.]